MKSNVWKIKMLFVLLWTCCTFKLDKKREWSYKFTRPNFFLLYLFT